MPTMATPPRLPSSGGARGISTDLLAVRDGRGRLGGSACVARSRCCRANPLSSLEKTPAIASTTTIRRHAGARQRGEAFASAWRLRPLPPSFTGRGSPAGWAAGGALCLPPKRLPAGACGSLGSSAAGKRPWSSATILSASSRSAAVLAQVPDRVSAADRVRLAQEVLGQADVPVGVGAAELLERGPGALAGFAFVEAEEVVEILERLASGQEHFEHGALVGADRHGRKGMEPGLSAR